MTQDKTEIEKQRQLPDLEWDIEHIDKHWLGSDSLDADRPHSQLANSCWERVKSEISKLQAKVQEMESWKPDEDSYLCGYQQAVLNSTGIIVSPNEGAGSFSRWLQRLSQRTSPPTENHYAEKLVNLNRQIESLQAELSALKEQNRWIPVSDPPVLNGKYLVYCENEQFEATYENGKWTRGFGWIYSVESWTGLLPTPQKPEEV